MAGPGVVGGDYTRVGTQAEEPWEPFYPLQQGTVISSAPSPLAERRAMSSLLWMRWECGPLSAQEEEEETVLVNTQRSLSAWPQVVALSGSVFPATALRGV